MRFPSISLDGRYVAFESDANDLVSADSNVERDVFLRDRGPQPVNYCAAGTATNGCVARMSGTGVASATSSRPFLLRASGIEGNKPGLFFYGVNGRLAAPWAGGASSSYLCVRLPVQRMWLMDSGGTPGVCDGSFTVDWNALMAITPDALGQPRTAGQVVDAQAWFRDPTAPGSTNLSDGVEFIVDP